uniref:protocadherin Fat 4-like n=1 Tax=Monopterus albus TaxID=43700 RepID=UPI0009B37AAF|nr:protocadherin Fat 4-like [Monopterus albus]
MRHFIRQEICFSDFYILSKRTMRRQVLFFITLYFAIPVFGQVSYTINEEMSLGSVVGNVAEDLGLDAKRLKSRNARVYFGDSSEYVELNRATGVLLIKERIDREALCAQTMPCVVHFQIILEKPIEFYRILLDILDINDNPPTFEKSDIKFKLSESAVTGAKFDLEGAVDFDVGSNGLQTYVLEPTDNFALKLHNQADGSSTVEMILKQPLDREKNEHLSLVLTAVDGGEPRMSGTMQILITVLDANDNAPVFTKPVYKATVAENSPKGTAVTIVSASDADQGSNGRITYSIRNTLDDVRHLFEINEHSGEVRLIGNIDYEKSRNYLIHLRASDDGGLTDMCKLIVDIIDVNDNNPLIDVMSKTNVISEDVESNTVVTIINIQDLDDGENGKVRCTINENVPFLLKSTDNNFYSLVTDSELDRERASEYNITVTCSDEGVPSLSSSVTLTLQISDVNDNAPVFERSSYEAYIVENNTPGLSIFTVKARDADWNQNARVSYILEDSSVNGVPVSSYVSVSADSGVIHAVRSFDYEQIKDFHFRVKAQDGGSPPLSSNVTVKILIQDQNDNPPQVLYPVQTGGSVVAEMVPRSADVGYLVTKVVAVDVDSGQNAWLSYKLQKATDRALFEVGLQNGEIRTIRQVTDKDTVKQRLTVIVEDNGQPSRSATVIVNVAVADSFPEVLSEFTDFPHDKEYNDNLTFYLVLALAVVSFLFITCLVVIISVKSDRWRQSRILYHSNLPVIPYYPPRYSDTLGTGTLQHVYNYEVCRTTDSRKSDCKFGGAGSQNVLIMDPSSTGTMQQIQGEKSILDEPDSPLEVTYSVPEEMTKGSLVGNIAQDLGLDVKRLKSGKARIYTEGNAEYIELNKDRGVLLVKERIDREALCGQTTPCALHLQITLEDPIEFYTVTVEINDINDNAPSFQKDEMKFRISESAVIGAKFVLERAMDLDVGVNGLQSYSLKPTDNFNLKLQNQQDGSKKVEMVLQKHLDREAQEHLSLTLTATDGGDPQLAGTMRVEISVLDANDNAPVFTQEVYKAIIVETAPIGTILNTVSAVDADEGSNGKVSYSITNTLDDVHTKFKIDDNSGVISLTGNMDYEKAQHYEIHVQASDDGGLTDSCKIIVEVIDTNDNNPSINIMSKTNSVSEDSKPGTVVTIFNVQDPDSGNNGKVACNINEHLPFVMKSTSKKFFSLVTDSELDRERASEYNITVTCSDEGVPSLSSSVTLTLQISDVNDNAPVFERSSYEAYIVENNTPGLSIFTVKARDADWNQNARVSYILEDSSVNGVPVSSYVSVSADSGVIHAVRSFDYEQIKDFHFRVKAQDGGSPPLSSNVTVKILIQDQNDNPPQVLYPVQTGGSVVAEMVPRSADVGYLVTKVVAVDVDSGQNAWLSYKLQKATDRALFEVGLQNGEIRTIRQVTDKDTVKQRLTVIVEDNGQPSRSATVIVNVAVADSFPEVLSEFTDFPHDKEYNDNLTFYLVLALAVVSFLFITCLVVIISVKSDRWRQSRILYHSNLPVIPYYPPRYSDTLGTGTLQHVYNYEVCRTTDSRKSDCKFGGAEYNITVTCSDEGVPSLSSSVTLTLQISDVNDNAPVFERSSYEAYIVENNTPGLSIFTVKARDADWNQNARVSYILEDSSVNGVPVSSYVSVSADSGVIHAVRSFDYEQIKDFHFRVKAQDGGSPPLSSNVTVKILIQDQNDNPPQVLYPVQTGGSVVAEMVPRSADVGYLVTKVVAVDVDSGQNAWLSYKLQKATDRALFEVGLQNGEIRTIRQVTDKDTVKQRLTVIVEDNGQPSRSATVIVNVAVADSFPEVLSEFTDFPHDKEYNDNLTFYLVLALAVVSFLFITCLVVIISVKIYRWRQSRILYHSNLPVIPYYPPRYSDTLGTGTLQHVYNYEVCRTTDSRKSDCKFGGAGSQNVLIMDPSSTGTMQRIQGEKSILDEPDSPVESTYTATVFENAPEGTIVTSVTASDADYGTNDSELDRERASEYNITVTCSDEGVPSLSSSVTLTLQISDVNDNAPVFERSSYEAYIVENNTPGLSIFTVKARDADWNQNARVSYILEDSSVNGVPVSSYVSVSADSGVIHAVRSFDYEQIKDFHFRVKAQDGGSPPLTIVDFNSIHVDYSLVHLKLEYLEKTMRRQVLLFILVPSLASVFGQVSYSVPEEMEKGSLVCNVAQDLGLDLKRLKSGRARVHSGDSVEYIELDRERGVLLIKERIDRETLCGETTPCALHLQMILENPMELFRITIEVTDINDNAPSFASSEKRIEISESAITGSKFLLEKAVDADIGANGLQTYSLNPTNNFALKLENQADGSKKVEMVLQKPLDREHQEQISLLLTALDGGQPRMSGTMQITVIVLDVNDNAPVFTKSLYKATITENSPRGTSVITVSASDKDGGSNAEISYAISNSKRRLTDLFQIERKTGEVTLLGEIDYEKAKLYQIDIEAIDSGGLSDSSKILIDITDVNDNSPQLKILSKSDTILEDSPENTVIAMLSVNDPDSERNGEVKCNINDDIPFKIQNTMNGFFSIFTLLTLDREVANQYNITVTCSDEGVPSLSSSVTLTLQISDVNDNAPVFERSSYEAYIVENNTPGLSIFTVKARDADWNQNARVSYILEDSSVNGVPVSSYVSVSADSGVIHAVRSFDYEQIKDFHFRVKAQDGGSPPLSSNVTVKILIQDQNDNPPQVLYPVQTGGSVVAEMVPRSADVGYLVTKVVAVDVDSGQNAWLSYKLQKATDRALFEVGLQNGEIRTIRQVTDKDTVKQRLTVIVEDNGQPSRSATVIVNVAVADSFPEVLSEFTDFPHDKEYNDNLTFYLVLALAVVSFLFITCLVVIISVKIYRWRQSRILYHSNLPVIPYYPPRYSDTLGTGTLQHVYNYEVCRTTDSRKSDCKFGGAGSQNVLIMDPSSTGTMQRVQGEKSILDEPDSPLEVRMLPF